MAYKLEPQPGDRRAGDASAAEAETTFRISTEPVVENGHGEGAATAGAESDNAVLPTSYGTQALYLMARDPHSLFAYWDVDWREAFRDRMPRDRKVHLRVMRSDGAEETSLEVEPMAGSCYIDVSAGDESYTADLGYYEPAGVWNSVAVSMPVATPPDSIEGAEAPDFATVPFHISFQRMIDMFRVSKHENESLTAMLAGLRERAASEETSSTMTEEEREIVRAIDDAVAESGSAPTAAERPDLWVHQNLERILGFGARTTSPEGGFGTFGAGS
jgi:hypothetical protein